MMNWSKQNVKPKSVESVQTTLKREDMIVTFCSGEAHVLASEVVKLISLDMGQHVRLWKDGRYPRFGWHGQSRDNVATVLYVNEDGILQVGFHGAYRGLKADPAEMERVEELKIGDWVRVKASVYSMSYGWEDITPNIYGVMYNLDEDGDVGIAFSFRSKQFLSYLTDINKVVSFHEGQEIHMIPSITQPRLGWSNKTPATLGKIMRINIVDPVSVLSCEVTKGDITSFSSLDSRDGFGNKVAVGFVATSCSSWA